MQANHLDGLRVCIVAENASFRFGGEASLPLQYFARLRARGIEAWLIAHGRTEKELIALFPEDRDRIHFLADRWFHKVIWRLGHYLPRRLSEAIFGSLIVLINQLLQRRLILDLISIRQVNIVHQPVPVSPRAPSCICKLGVPVVIGPMNGGMDYPEAFKKSESRSTRVSVELIRRSANFINRCIPGKHLADVLLVANERTRLALPANVKGRVIELCENGADLEMWSIGAASQIERRADFLFIGRLIDWKRLDLAIHAISRIPEAQLTVIGDGAMRASWTALAAELNLAKRVSFVGWLPQQECARYLRASTALLLPSIYECGGAVILEAMAAGIPAIATAWGGPADYLDESCGILIDPSGGEAVIAGFTGAMLRLIDDPNYRDRLGRAAREKVERHFSWDKKVEEVCRIYRSARSPSGRPGMRGADEKMSFAAGRSASRSADSESALSR